MRRSRMFTACCAIVPLALSLAWPHPAGAELAEKTPPEERPRPGPIGPQECPVMRKPLISLTLEPARPCPGDSVTLRWQVKDRRQGVAWAYPVTLTGPPGLPVDLPDPAPSKGSRTFTAVAGVLRAGGEFTLTTRCGEQALSWEVRIRPHVDEVRTMDGERTIAARQGTLVKLVGRGFGDPPDQRPSARFLRDGERPVRMTVVNFANAELTVLLRGEDDMEAGRGAFEVVAGCSSNRVPFEVLR